MVDLKTNASKMRQHMRARIVSEKTDPFLPPYIGDILGQEYFGSNDPEKFGVLAGKSAETPETRSQPVNGSPRDRVKNFRADSTSQHITRENKPARSLYPLQTPDRAGDLIKTVIHLFALIGLIGIAFGCAHAFS